MARIRPFPGIRYARRPGVDFSNLIAPPFDVQDETSKAALQAKDPQNIVNIDLPHIPPKAAGPIEKYHQATATLNRWLESGVLAQDQKAAFYPYTQSYQHRGLTYHRKGFFALVRLSPFGQGQVVPHEKTYKGAIEDRLALMRVTQMQLSPIFGLYNDPHNEITSLLYKDLGRPDQSGTLDGVKHDLWRMVDNDIENRVIDLMGTKPVYIADGHHRYTTALTYQKEMEEQRGGALPPNHPANFCLFTLIGMQDPGLLIHPTHRLLSGLDSFDITAFERIIGEHFDVVETSLGADRLEEYADTLLPKQPAHTMGLFDKATGKLYQLQLKNLDVLKNLEPGQSEAWRHLDVAILQRYLLDEVLQPKFASGKELVKAYNSDGRTLASQIAAGGCQIALILQSTPLHALDELGRHNEVMPQKSTYFYPKLATGMIINPLRAGK